MKMQRLVIILAMLAVLGSACTAFAEGDATGVYEAAAKGFGGEVKAVVTFDAGKIVDVALSGEQETENIGGVALETVKAQILEAQGVEIDGVAGATVTTAAAKEAVQACIGRGQRRGGRGKNGGRRRIRGIFIRLHERDQGRSDDEGQCH